MIIKSYRTPTRYGHDRFRSHIFRGDENEQINLIQGVEQDAKDMFEDAQRRGQEYAIRHFIISPAAETTREEMMHVVHDVAKEFGFDPTIAVVVEHQKPRKSDGNFDFDRHWHVLVPDRRYEGNGTVVATSHSFPRQEKIARLAEWRLGHPFVLGAHHNAVISALKREGWRQAALALSKAFPNGTRPQFAFTHAEAQAAKRKGVNLSDVRSVVRKAWQNTLTVNDLFAEVAKHNLHIEVGRRDPPAWVVTDAGGETLMRLTKAAHVTKAEIFKRLGEPSNGSRNQEIHEPFRALDDNSRINARHAEGNQEPFIGNSCVATQCNAGDRGLSPQAFLEGLNNYSARIEHLANRAAFEAAPPLVRLERSLAALETKARAQVLSADTITLAESRVLRACRRDLIKAEERRSAALERSNRAYEELRNLQKMPEPSFFGRRGHQQRLRTAETKYDQLKRRLEKQSVEYRSAADRVEFWERHHKAELDAYSAPILALAASARERLAVIQSTRALVSRRPMLLRFGPLGVYQYALRQKHNEPRQREMWDGSKDIWGIPLQPPLVRF